MSKTSYDVVTQNARVSLVDL